jgi:hypothetical protein
MKKGLILLLSLVIMISIFGCAAPRPTTVTVIPPPVTIKITPPTVTVTPPPVTVTITPYPSALPSPNLSPTPQVELGYSRGTPAGIKTQLQTKIDRFLAQGGDNADCTVRLTLLKFIRGSDAWRVIEGSNEYNPVPPEGYEYVLATLLFEFGKGPVSDTTLKISNRWFTSVSSSGQDYPQVALKDLINSIAAELQSGGLKEGKVALLVSKNDQQPLLTFGRNSEGNGGLWFKLW